MELTIEKLVYGGDGLARLAPGDGESRAKTVFVPYVLSGERVEATIVEERPGFARAGLERVLQASELRTAPPCPYFGKCGGCHYQHTGYDQQLRLKSEILRETLRRTAKLELAMDIQTHASPPLHYRNRTRFHVRTKPQFQIGYFRHGSHELLAVRECPISSPLINRALTNLWRAGEANKMPAEIGEIELFANAADDRLMIELYLRAGSGVQDSPRNFSGDLAALLPEIHGVAGFARSASRLPGQATPMPESLWGDGAMQYDVADASYRVSAGAFFQTNRHLVQHMVEIAVGERTGRVALDLYSGVGLFAVSLARRFGRVVAVESSPVSAADLRANVPANAKISSQSAEAYLTSVAGTLKPDLIVADPPRAGLGTAVCSQIGKLNAREIVYVSCDPATLARDLKQLTTLGWRISAMHMIDLFPQTFHIETCAVLRRA